MEKLSPEEHLDVFLRAHSTIGVRLSQAFAKEGAVPPNQARVLTLIARSPGRRLRIDELAHESGMTKGAISRIVDRLEAAGFVERQTSQHDRRAIYAVLTPEGRDALRHVTGVFRSVFKDVFLAGLTEDELNTLSGLLSRLDRANKLAQTAAPLSQAD